MTDDEINERFQEYWRYIDSCVRDVQTEMGLRNIDNEESLVQSIESKSEFICSTEAFTFFNDQSPYEWREYATAEMLELHNYDLGMMILSIVNSAVSIDVFRKLAITDGYRFLTEGRETKTISWMINGKPQEIVMREYWRSRSAIYDHLPAIEITEYEGKELTVYQESDSEDFAFILAHDDPTLIFRSKWISSEQELTVDDYESRKVETLLEYGFPESELWLTEVQTVEDFNNYYSLDEEVAEKVYGIGDCSFVLYLHESGSVLSHAGFSTISEFKEACQYLAKYFKK